MEQLRLTNTLSRKKEVFTSREPGRVKMFTCGPSVYSRAHIGNYRTFLFEDLLQRYLEHIGYRVERMINFTDVEDKGIEEAQAKDITLRELTEPVEQIFMDETHLLGIRLPHYIPRSSTSVEQAVRLIKILLEKGYAYFHHMDVFYDPLKYKGFGRLFGLDMSRWPKQRHRFGRDTYPGQRWNLGDFVLWHGSKGDHIYWNTEIGIGRPSWNIQDAAMITKHMGFRIDIACGGVDNLYRHHDYTLALVESIAEETFCPYWLHGELVLVNGRKMSKSRGNVVYLEDLAKQGYTPRAVRFAMIYRHYRERLNLSSDYLDSTTEKLETFNRMVRTLCSEEDSDENGHPGSSEVSELGRTFVECMNDDLDVRTAFDRLAENLAYWVALKSEGRFSASASGKLREELAKIDSVLQVMDRGGR
jgi:cysteinyl-tRNA synthetase